jgi:hypothetical protein
MMTSLVHQLFGRRGRELPSLVPKVRGSAGRVILRGASKRAYSFEAMEREAAGRLVGGAVYIYARRVEPDAPHAAGVELGGAALELGYIGRTGNMAEQDAAHAQLGHFLGRSFDLLLILAIDQEAIRADIEGDLIALHRPKLNELLGSSRAAGAS